MRIVVRHFHGYIWQLAHADFGTARVRVLDPIRGVVRGIADRPVKGWYGGLGGELLALGVPDNELRVIVADEVLTVDDGFAVELERHGSEQMLIIRVDGARRHAITYSTPSLPLAASLDPTFDETPEEWDFGRWLERALRDDEHRELLRTVFSGNGSRMGCSDADRLPSGLETDPRWSPLARWMRDRPIRLRGKA